MSKKKKSGNKDNHGLETIVFVTAILELINILIELISKLIE